MAARASPLPKWKPTRIAATAVSAADSVSLAGMVAAMTAELVPITSVPSCAMRTVCTLDEATWKMDAPMSGSACIRKR